MNKQRILQLFGIFGYPLTHTVSPSFQEAGFEAAGIPAHYLVLELGFNDFRYVMKNLRKIPLRGFNVTVPYKEKIIPFLDRLEGDAKTIGAVNTVFRKGKLWIGANTDVYGLSRALRNEAHYEVRRQRVLVFGGGGAARAAVFACAKAGASEIQVLNRHPGKAKRIIRDMKKCFSKVNMTANGLDRESLIAGVKKADLIINATSLGLKKSDPAILGEKEIPSVKGGRKLFFDLIYVPARTPFLKAASRKGHRILNGKSMLLYQGCKAWEIWTGRKAPETVMRKTLDMVLKGKQ